MNTLSTNYPPMSPYLTVKDASKAIEFYQAAFGATELYRLTDASRGGIGHAEIKINGSHLMLADENPAWGNKSPLTLGGTAVKLCLMVANTDAAVARASAAGATVEMPPADMFYGFRCAAISDPLTTNGCFSMRSKKSRPKKCRNVGMQWWLRERRVAMTPTNKLHQPSPKPCAAANRSVRHGTCFRLRLSATTQRTRQPRPSLSLGSLGASTRVL